MSTKKLQVLDYKIKQAENADTVDNKHASDFASATDMSTAQNNISDLQAKVGDTPVSTQITNAISSNRIVYVQNEEPVDAPPGSLWVNLELQNTDDFVSVYKEILIFGIQYVALVDSDTLII